MTNIRDEIEIQYKTVQACVSGTQMGLMDEKNMTLSNVN